MEPTAGNALVIIAGLVVASTAIGAIVARGRGARTVLRFWMNLLRAIVGGTLLLVGYMFRGAGKKVKGRKSSTRRRS